MHKIFFAALFFSASCGQNTAEEQIIPVEVVLEGKQDYTISWIDSGRVNLDVDKFASYPDLDYDSATILCYWGYNHQPDLDDREYFPVNEKGQWINTIIQTSTVGKSELTKVDSLIGSPESYDSSRSAAGWIPKYGIVYYKKGTVVGQTGIGPGSQTIRTTFQITEPSPYKRLRNHQYLHIETILNQRLNLYGTADQE